MNPIVSQKTMMIAPSFGTKVRVSSWIEVRAWNSPTISPATSATARIGKDIMTETQSPSRRVSKKRTSSSIASDRHTQDFLVGLDHAVAHRHRSLNREFGLCERLHERMRIGSAGHRRRCGFLSGAEGFGEIPGKGLKACARIAPGFGCGFKGRVAFGRFERCDIHSGSPLSGLSAEQFHEP